MRTTSLIRTAGILLFTGGVLFLGAQFDTAGRERSDEEVVVAKPGTPTREVDTDRSDRELQGHGARSQAEPLSRTNLRFVLKRAPESRFTPLDSGTLVVRLGQVVASLPIQDGRCTLDWSEHETNTGVVEAVTANGRSLRVFESRLNSDNAGALVECYDYPGSFVQLFDERGEVLEAGDVFLDPTVSPATPIVTDWHPGNLLMLRKAPGEHGSPIYLESLHERCRGYWLRANGHSWVHVSGAAALDRARVVRTCVAAGELQVLLRDFSPRRGQELRLQSDGRVICSYRNMDVATVLLEGLPAGEFLLELHGSSESESGARLDATTVAIRVGARALAVMRQPAPPSGEAMGRLVGTLVIESPELWRDTDLYRRATLELLPADQSAALASVRRAVRLSSMESLAGRGASVLSWELGSVPAGEYSLEIASIGFRSVVVVMPSGTAADLVVPPLSRVLFESEAGGGNVDSLFVTSLATGHSAVLSGVEGLDGEGTFTVISLPGSIEVHAVGSTFGSWSKVVSVEAGWNHVLIAPPALYSIELQLDGSSESIAQYPWWTLKFTGEEAAGECVSRLVMSSGAHPGVDDIGQFFFTEPDWYRIEYPGADMVTAPTPVRIKVDDARRERVKLAWE